MKTIQKDGSLLMLGTPRRILTVSDKHVVVEGGKSISLKQALLYPYSPPAIAELAGKVRMMQQARLL